MTDETRELIERGENTLMDGELIRVRNIVVRRGVPLLEPGQRVVAVDEHRIVKMAGVVTRVDEEKHSYEVSLRRSIRRVV